MVGVAPRRDWFISSEMNLKTLPRVVGGTTEKATDLMAEVLGIVCDKVLKAKDHRHAELVKSIENAYRHVEITLANQLSLAYPDIDMREVLKLVGTKWNIGTYHPSFGTGGYCIPLSSKYVIAGASNKDKLSILGAAQHTDDDMPMIVANSIIEHKYRKVGILGLAYKGDLKVHTLSPTIRIAEYLRAYGILVKIHDPYYTESEIMKICGTESFEFPEGLAEFDAVLVVADHRAYQALTRQMLLPHLMDCKLVLDNTGIWQVYNLPDAGIEYHLAGTENWL